MSISLTLKNAANSLLGTLFRTNLIADMTAIENEVNNIDVVVNGLTQNVTQTWVSGTTYAINDFRRSPINFQTYRRLTNGAGTTDPSLDATNWIASAAGNSSQVFLVAPATSPQHAIPASQIQSGSLAALTAALTGTEYAATPSPAITAYAANQAWDITFASACPAAPTLKLNGIATPPNLVRQNVDGSYSNLAAGSFPAGWRSTVRAISASQVLVDKLPPRSITLEVTRDVSLASGNVAYTGAGFKARKFRMRALIPGTSASSDGLYEGPGSIQRCVYTGNPSAGSFGFETSPGFLFISAGNYLQITVASIDSDGITVTYTKTNSPTGTARIFIDLED